MRAGTYKHRVTIESKTVTLDAYGQEVITWVTVGTYWGLVEDLTGREYLAQGTVETATMTTRVFVRAHIGTVELDSRIIWDGHIYNIRYVSDRDVDLEIGCVEVVDVS